MGSNLNNVYKLHTDKLSKREQYEIGIHVNRNIWNSFSSQETVPQMVLRFPGSRVRPLT